MCVRDAEILKGRIMPYIESNESVLLENIDDEEDD